MWGVRLTLSGLWPPARQCMVFGWGEEFPELADGPSGCGKVARGGCFFAWNFSVIISTVLAEVGEKKLDQT